MMAFLVSSSILIVLSLGLPSMVSRDRMGRHPPKGRVGGEFLLALQTLLWCPRNGSNFREIRIPEARFPRRTLLKLSEKSRTLLQHSLTGHLNGTFRAVLAFVYRLNLRSRRCSYPFSDSYSRKF